MHIAPKKLNGATLTCGALWNRELKGNTTHAFKAWLKAWVALTDVNNSCDSRGKMIAGLNTRLCFYKQLPLNRLRLTKWYHSSNIQPPGRPKHLSFPLHQYPHPHFMAGIISYFGTGDYLLLRLLIPFGIHARKDPRELGYTRSCIESHFVSRSGVG